MPLILPPAVPLVVAAPPALVAPGAPSALPSPYVLRHPAPTARAVAELAAEVRQGWRDWDPRPWWRRPSWPDPPPLMELDSNDKVFLTDADDFSDLRGHPGLNFVVIGSVSGKTVRLTGAGTADKPVVLRGASDDGSGGGTNLTELVNCSGPVFSTGSTRCVLYRFRADTCLFTPDGGSFCRVARCRFYGNSAPNAPLSTGDVSDLRIDRCVYGQIAGKRTFAQFIYVSGRGGTGNIEACYNHILGYVSEAGKRGGTIVSMHRCNTNEAPVDRRPGFSLWAHHTLCSGASGPEGFNFTELKITDAIISDNTILYDVAGGPGINIRSRHGVRNRFERNLVKYLGGGRGGGDIQLRDCDHWVGENAALNADGSVNTSTQVTLWGGNLDADRWLTDRVAGSEHNLENAKRARVGGNAMNVVVGVAVSTFPDLPPYPATFGADACVVPPDGRADGNASSTLTPGWNVNTDRSTGLAYRIANARALVALGPTDVGLELA